MCNFDKINVEKLVLYLKKSKQNAKKIGIKKRFVYYVTFLIILIVAIIFIGDSYAIQIARTNASDSYKSTVQLYSNRIDMILGEIDFGMLNLVSKDDHFTSFDSDADELQMTLQQIGLSSTLSEVIDYYPSAGLMFFYDLPATRSYPPPNPSDCSTVSQAFVITLAARLPMSTRISRQSGAVCRSAPTSSCSGFLKSTGNT